RTALHLEKDRRAWVYLQGGSDGRDGPTDAAGGFIDAARLAQMRGRVDVEALLANNDAYAALEVGDALLMTGGTGTNVADLGVLIRA
ncbi:MAG: MOFRL family protein, partial [Pseudomonadota bacterium]